MTSTDSLADIEEGETSRKLILFGRDVSTIPCFRESFLTGIPSGFGIGLAAFLKTSRPQLSSHIGFTGFMVVTLGYWMTCRYNWSKQRFEVAQVQEALRQKILIEGTAVEKQLEKEGLLKEA